MAAAFVLQIIPNALSIGRVAWFQTRTTAPDDFALAVSTTQPYETNIPYYFYLLYHRLSFGSVLS
jgi:hypothetical protein